VDIFFSFFLDRFKKVHSTERKMIDDLKVTNKQKKTTTKKPKCNLHEFLPKSVRKTESLLVSETAAVSCGTSHASAASTPLR